MGGPGAPGMGGPGMGGPGMGGPGGPGMPGMAGMGGPGASGMGGMPGMCGLGMPGMGMPGMGGMMGGGCMGGCGNMMMMQPNMKVGTPIKGMPGMFPIINTINGEEMVVGFMPMAMAAAMGLAPMGSAVMGMGGKATSSQEQTSKPPDTTLCSNKD